MSGDDRSSEVTAALEPFIQTQIDQAGRVRKGRREHNLHGTPRVGQAFWVDPSKDRFHPEFEGERPAVVARAADIMRSSRVVVPGTHADQLGNPHALLPSKNPNKDDGDRAVWVVCDHLQTVALGRLRRAITKEGNRDPIRMPDADLLRVSSNLQRASATVMGPAPKPDAPPVAPPRPKGPDTLSLPAGEAKGSTDAS